jgi:hypothetical protein
MHHKKTIGKIPTSAKPPSKTQQNRKSHPGKKITKTLT